jgi:hypothetical protein
MTSASITFDQALQRLPRRRRKSRIRKAEPSLQVLVNDWRRDAKAAAKDLIAPLRALSKRERIAVAESLIGTFMALIDDVTKGGDTSKAFDPNQPRDERGRWSEVAGAAARGAGRLGLKAGKFVLRTAMDGISAISLIPSTRGTVKQSLQDWWHRFNQPAQTDARIGAVAELAGRTMVTIVLGLAAIMLAEAFIGAAVGSVGAAVGAALRVLLGM